MNNPFFDQVRDGCKKAEAELEGYGCYYIGPSEHREDEQLKIVDDLLTRGVDAMAISPSNAPAMANLLRNRAPDSPIITNDADALRRDEQRGGQGCVRTGRSRWSPCLYKKKKKNK